MLLMMFACGTVSATIYSTDDFETDTVGGNPTSNWYSYSESSGERNIGNISTGDAYSDSRSFYINDSDIEENAFSNFTFTTVTYYDTFSFRFKIPDHNWHTQINVSILDSSNQILGSIGIANTADEKINFFFNNTGSGILSQGINDSMWYRVVIDFNLTTDRIGCYLYNETNSGALLTSGWGAMEDGAGTYVNVRRIQFFADSYHDNTSIYIDDLNRAYTYINPNQASIEAVVVAITALFAVAILLSIITMAMTGAVTPEALIGVAVTVIIGVVTLIIVSGL